MKFLVGLAGGIIGAVFGGTALLFVLNYTLKGDQFGVILLGIAYGLFAVPAGLIGGIILAVTLFTRLRKAEPKPRVARVLACYVGVPIALTIGMIVIMQYAWAEPEASAMISTFHNNRSSFDKILEMMRQGAALTSVTDDGVEPFAVSTSVSGDRLEQYRRLYSTCGSHEGIFKRDDGEIDIPVWSQGCAPCTDIEKGYAYSGKQPDHVVSDPERAVSNLKEGTHIRVYQRIEGHWYLYIEVDG